MKSLLRDFAPGVAVPRQETEVVQEGRAAFESPRCVAPACKARFRGPRAMVVSFVLIALCTCSLAFSSWEMGAGNVGARIEQAQGDRAVEPVPGLSPDEVVKIQLDALQHNDVPAKDHGIAIAFKFASPGNRVTTGPLEKFILLVKNPAYSPMLNHRSADVGKALIRGSDAQVKAVLIDAQGQTVTYIFILSKQQDAPYANCWMTDSVIRVPEQQPEPGRPIA